MREVEPEVFQRAQDYLTDRGFAARMRIEDIVASVQLDVNDPVDTELTMFFGPGTGINPDSRLYYSGSFNEQGRLGANQCAVALMLGFFVNGDNGLNYDDNIKGLIRALAPCRFNLQTQGQLAISRIIGTSLTFPGPHMGNGGDAGVTFAPYIGEDQQDALEALEGIIPVNPNEVIKPSIVQKTAASWTSADVYFSVNLRMLVADQGQD